MLQEQEAFKTVEKLIVELDNLKMQAHGYDFSIDMYYNNLSETEGFVIRVREAVSDGLGGLKREETHFRSNSLFSSFLKCWEYFHKREINSK